jgi:BirA family transcriptional regulator, biotin operon repressor / biotin---[acetyl-CoA-carboxylase] ligase
LSGSFNTRGQFDVVELDEVDSTNAEAIRRAGGLLRPTWFFAHKQTAGRGRRGKPWVDPAGNFAATLMLRPDCTAQEAALRSFVAAVALKRTLAIYIDHTKIGLKWPNDVLLNGGKVAGILLESSGRGGRMDWLAIGIGVNLRNAPDPGIVEVGAIIPVSVWGETKVEINPRKFLDVLALQFVGFEACFETYGFGYIKGEWLMSAVRRRQTITARTSTDRRSVFLNKGRTHAARHRLWQYQYRVQHLGWHALPRHMAHCD